jgi:hypothetical protein
VITVDRTRRAGIAALGVLMAILSVACAGSFGNPDPEYAAPGASASPALVTAAPPAGDGPPNHADNNGWKQRHELTAAQQKEGDALAARIRPALTTLRSAKDFAPESTRRALIGLGLADDTVGVTTMRPPTWDGAPPPGAVFEVRFGTVGCVIGTVAPDRLQVQVTGSAAEFGCLEPFSH